jgi:hemolysin activation/secretion protein
VNSDRKVFEQDETLIGAGLGLELQVLRYLNARVDWGFVLQDIELPGEDVEVGDNRLHFVVTVSF